MSEADGIGVQATLAEIGDLEQRCQAAEHALAIARDEVKAQRAVLDECINALRQACRQGRAKLPLFEEGVEGE